MSQAGELNVTQNHPEIPTTFDANTGSATPLANVINIFGQKVAAGSLPVTTTAAGNTLTVDVQTSQAIASTDATKIGLAAFNSADFTVDANGYVSASGTGTMETLTGNSGGAVSPTAGNINTVGTGSITIVGNPGTSTLTTQLTGLTAHNVLLGEGTATVGLVAPSSTSGVPLISQGASSDPAFGTAVVAGGGTGDTSFTAYMPICGGTTSTGALQSVTTGTAGYVLTYVSSAALPTWQASGASLTVDGDTGSATPSGGTLTIYANNTAQNCGSSVLFSGSGSTLTFKVTDALLNTLIGHTSGNATVSGLLNTALGAASLNSLTSGSGNVAIGEAALQLLTSTNGNTAVGQTALEQLVTGVDNIALGVGAGVNYLSSESSNIMIGNVGTLGESNVIRIGTQGLGPGQQNKFFAAGITGVGLTTAAVVTQSSGQLGTSTITAGTGISVTAGASTITIAATGSEMTWTDNATSFAAVAGNGYFITAGSVVATMPASPSQGDTIAFTVDTTSSFEVLANTGQVIRIGSAVSASAGNAQSNARGDSLTLVYRSTGTAWIAKDVIGTWTVT